MNVVMPLLLLICCSGFAQTQPWVDQKSIKSYRYFKETGIEDNSIFIDEAFNQDKGVQQHITTFSFFREEVILHYTHELPLINERHQLSVTVPYSISNSQNKNYHGINDVTVAYQYWLLKKDNRLMATPGIAFQIPTGDTQVNNQSGFAGLTGYLALSKRISDKLIIHTNGRLGYFKKIKSPNQSSDLELPPTKFHSGTSGISFVWLVSDKLNFLIENINTREHEFINNKRKTNNQYTLNPGLRTCFNSRNTQFVLGASCPTNLVKNKKTELGFLFYLSIETSNGNSSK